MYELWHSWGLRPLASILLAAHVLLGAWFILELNFAVVSGAWGAPAGAANRCVHPASVCPLLPRKRRRVRRRC